MKKIVILLFIIFVIIISTISFADNNIIGNKDISISFNVEKNNVNVSNFIDKKQNLDFIKNPINTKSLWMISIKKDKDYNGKDIKLYPNDAESLKVNKEKNKIVFIWNNVKKDNMTKGYNVIGTCEIKNENSYWHIKVESPKDYTEYGLWEVRYPIISDIDAQNGDLLLYPLIGNSYPITKYSEKGLENPTYHNQEDFYTSEFGITNPSFLQYSSFTKNNSTLYMSPEDLTNYSKTILYSMREANHLNIEYINYATHMAEAGYDFNQPYKTNIAVVQGDWYDSAKKYRKWGIDSKAAAFRRGKIEDRQDIPEWLKKNCVWLHGHGHQPTSYDSIIKSQELLGVPCSCHMYTWSKYPYDTHYPNWLPAHDTFKEGVKRLQDNNIHVMPYFNGHMTDMALSPTFKKYGDVLMAKFCDGSFLRESWSKDLGADNAAVCITSKEYTETLTKEIINAIREYNFDAIYLDQVGIASQPLCFNEKHSHAFGGGDYYVKEYNNLIDDIKNKASEIKGIQVPMATECVGEAFNFDMYLRVNDFFGENEYYPLSSVIFSGYEVNFGHPTFEDEMDTLSAINKTAIALVDGVQPGWGEGGWFEYEKHPKFWESYRVVAQARNAQLPFFNFGELVRKVNIISPIPTENLSLRNSYVDQRNFDFKLVKTGSLNYKGKTLIVFANISDKPLKVDWESNCKDLGLKKKDTYKIQEVYPTKEKEIISKKIKGSVIINGDEVKLFIVE